MSTTLSFPADLRRIAILTLAVAIPGAGLLGCGPQPQVAPNAPKIAAQAARQKPPRVEGPQKLKSVELRSVRVHKFDQTFAHLAGPQFVKEATDPLVIEVRVTEPIDPRPRTSSPIIVLNGMKLTDTWVVPEKRDTLVAFLPDRRMIRELNTVAAMWLGNEQLTLTKQPLTFKATDIKD